LGLLHHHEGRIRQEQIVALAIRKEIHSAGWLARGEVHRSDCSTITGFGIERRGLEETTRSFPRDQESSFHFHCVS
jgi:hypothetical protein